MALDLRDCELFGPALPEPFVKFDLEQHLSRLKLLPKGTGAEGKRLQECWEIYRRKLRELVGAAGDRRVYNHVLEPLVAQFGYARSAKQGEVSTREGMEDGGWLFESEDRKARLRVWSVGLDTDIDAPSRRGRAYRFSWSRIVQRVLLAKGERVGVLTNGEELRLLISDPARPDSHVSIRLDRVGGWRARRTVPDSYRLVLALASPASVAKIPDLTEAARLAQTRVTKELRSQARVAIEGFIQELIDNPQNSAAIAAHGNKQTLAEQLWQEGVILVYRLLFILKLESSADPARGFSFATVALWRQTYSPNQALGAFVRDHLDKGYHTGRILEDGLRTVFRLFQHGLQSRELVIKPLGGMLFGEDTTPLLDSLSWGERATAILLDRLLWTIPKGRKERERVHYGPLDVEDLGRVYEALIELEPGITGEPMVRLRRAKLEVVVPELQADPYRPAGGGPAPDPEVTDTGHDDETEDADEDEDEAPRRGKRTKVEWIEAIAANRFHLRAGLGRKASGSYYTPHPFVRFLVEETLGSQVQERSPTADPTPLGILKLKVLDPAMGSGHFLVEACRFLGDALYESCRLCDELASKAEAEAAVAKEDEQRERLLVRATALRQRVADLPDPDDELVSYLPSRAVEGGESGLSQAKALALCCRLIAVHCLYGVDKNALAVELAKLSLWLESYAEGLPLTFLDHRLVCGDSITGPFFEQLLTYPVSSQPLDDLFAQGLANRLRAILAGALTHVRDLEASIGKDVADVAQKWVAKAKLDAALEPLRKLAGVWVGAVMLGDEAGDRTYEAFAKAVTDERVPPAASDLVQAAGYALAYDLAFPEVFHPGGQVVRKGGFDAILSNPPWDAIQFKSKEFFATFDFEILNAPTKRERTTIERRMLARPEIANLFDIHKEAFERQKRVNDRLYRHQKVYIEGDLAGRQLDAFRVFAERKLSLCGPRGSIGMVVPSAFHANEGATGVRRVYLEQSELRCCYSFENRNKLFEIDSRFKFALIVARRPGPTESVACAFYLRDINWIFQRESEIHLPLPFIRETGGDYFSLVEPRTPIDEQILKKLFACPMRMGEWLLRLGISPSTSELPMLGGEVFRRAGNLDVRLPEISTRLLNQGLLPLHEGKTINQFTDLWIRRPRYLAATSNLMKTHPHWLKLSRYYRFGYRAISSSTNERTGIAALMAPPSVSTRKIASDINAFGHSNNKSLIAICIFNSFTFDYCLRSMAQTDVGLFIVKRLPVPSSIPEAFLVHAALRLTCNHAGYSHLWREQVGEVWREPTPHFAWPVLEGEDARWQVRAAINSVVANVYGLSRADYEHILASFNHRRYPKTPQLCLAMFDEVEVIGLEAFAKKHDPYWDIPLVTALPKPVVNVPGFDEGTLSDRSTVDRSGQMRLLPADHGPLFRPREASASPRAPRPANGDFDRETYELIELLLDEKGTIASSDAQDLTGLDAATVRPYLQQLVEEGKARVEGQRRGTRYHRIAYGKA